MDTKDKEKVRRPQKSKTEGTAKRQPARSAASAKKPQGKTRGTAAAGSQRRKPVSRQPETVSAAKPAAKQRTAGTTPNTAARKRPERAVTSRKRRADTGKQKKASVAQDVVYLPPKPFSRNRLLLRLASVVAVVLALVLGISVFFKVEAVMVYGNQKYSADDILEASGIEIGNNLLTFSRAKAGGRIIGTLPFVENVRFGIKLPGTVNIEITEVEVGYAVSDSANVWWLISSAGKVLQRLTSGESSGYTNLLGVKLENPQVGATAKALQEQTVQTDEEGNTIPVTVTAAKRLNTALNIVQYLEQNGIIGDAAYLDVSELSDIQLQYGRQYLVKLGDDNQLAYKISSLKAAVAKLTQEEPYSTGTLDIADPGNISYKRDK